MNKPSILDTSSWIEYSTATHKGYYDYSLSVYTRAKDNIEILCPVHGVFRQEAYRHSRGAGCYKCTKGQSVTLERFKEVSNLKHDNKYSYGNTIIEGIHDKVCITCDVHGDFYQKASNHMYLGRGCSQCSNNKKRTTEDFIFKCLEVHNSRYDYSNTIYKNAHSKVDIICKKEGHGIFSMEANAHIVGQGCPVCRQSKGELLVQDYLTVNGMDFTRQKAFADCRNDKQLYFDFYLEDLNICIEYDGEHHFMPVNYGDAYKADKDYEKRRLLDSIKDSYCLDNDITLIRISYLENVNDRLDNLLSTRRH